MTAASSCDGMAWHHFLGHDKEVVADLFHASYGAMRQVDKDFTSL